MMSADMLKKLNAVKAVGRAQSGYFKGALTPGYPHRAQNKFGPQSPVCSTNTNAL